MDDVAIADLIATAWEYATERLPAHDWIRRLADALEAAVREVEQLKQYHAEVLEELKDAEREVAELRGAARRLVAAGPNDDAAFDSALAELDALAGS